MNYEYTAFNPASWSSLSPEQKTETWPKLTIWQRLGIWDHHYRVTVTPEQEAALVERAWKRAVAWTEAQIAVPAYVRSPYREPVPYKPWSEMEPDEKTELALRTLDTLTYPTYRRLPGECSTTDPGPIPLDEMELLSRVCRKREIMDATLRVCKRSWWRLLGQLVKCFCLAT